MSAEGTGDPDDDPFEPAPQAEPTVLDLKKTGSVPERIEITETGDSGERSATSTSTPSSSGTTGLSRTSRSGVTTAAPLILQAEEHARAVALLRVVVALAIATLVALRLPREGPPGRPLATAMVALVLVV